MKKDISNEIVRQENELIKLKTTQNSIGDSAALYRKVFHMGYVPLDADYMRVYTLKVIPVDATRRDDFIVWVNTSYIALYGFLPTSKWLQHDVINKFTYYYTCPMEYEKYNSYYIGTQIVREPLPDLLYDDTITFTANQAFDLVTSYQDFT